MKTLTTNNLRTPEKISLPGAGAVEFSFDSYSLSGGEDDSFPAGAMALYPAAAAIPATMSANSSPEPAGASGYSYSWTKGVGRKGGKFYGYYDANKTNPYKGGVDCNMCWAGAASNSLAWWQKRYKVYNRIGKSVPTSAQAIFTRFRAFWTNKGGFQDQGVEWWLAGNSTLYKYYSSEQSTIRSKYKNNSTGGYYKSLYTAGSAAALSYRVRLEYTSSNSATQVASGITTAFNKGGVVSISIEHATKPQERHALSLWGIRRSSGGAINALYLTDSNDGRYGKRMLTVKVSYDWSRRLYRLKSGSYKNWYLTDYEVLGAFNRQNYSTPGSTKVSQKTNYVTFRWKNRSKGSDITHQVAYKKAKASTYTYLTTSASSLKVKLSSDGKYQWLVRTKVGTAFTSDWVKSSFTYRGTPPKITFYKATQKKYGKYKTKLGLRWKSNEKATFVLYLDGKRVFKGTGKSVSRRYFTVKNGTHQYTLVARDKYGNKSYTRGTLSCGVTNTTLTNNNVNNNQNSNRDTTPPRAPSPLAEKVYNLNCTLSWAGVSDPSGVTYEIEISYYSGVNQLSRYTVKTSSTEYTLSVDDYITRYWRVRAIDGAGNASAWKEGNAFSRYSSDSCSCLPAAATGAKSSAISLDKELALSADGGSPSGASAVASTVSNYAESGLIPEASSSLKTSTLSTLACATP